MCPCVATRRGPPDPPHLASHLREPSLNVHLRTPRRHHPPAYPPWALPHDGVTPPRLTILPVGTLAGLPPSRCDPGVDVVVATGHLTDSAEGTVRHLRKLFPRPLPIVLVLGPGEFQGSDGEVTVRQARRSAAAQGVTLLDDASAVIQGVRFVGSTLWTDFRLHGSDAATVEAALDAARPAFDGLNIRRQGRRLTPLSSTGLHWRSRSWLGLSLPTALPTVVVTHHAPTAANMPSSPFLDPLAASRASRCEDLVRQSGALLWIHGGRESVDHVVGRTRVVSRSSRDGEPIGLQVPMAQDEGAGVPFLQPLEFAMHDHPDGSDIVRSTPMPAQASLFEADGDHSRSVATGPGKTASSRRRAPPPTDVEGAARILDVHEDYRVLRRLRPRPVDPTYRLGPGESVALLVDVETTGLDHRQHEVIEIGMVAFAHDAEGRIGSVVGTLGMLREPVGDISPEITRLTGITAGMVAGRTIDLAAVRAMVEAADLVVAHNARFDRAFCERLDDAFRHKPWACSVAEVPWREMGFDGAKLGYLVNGCGMFHDGHRAVDDCHALLEVLAHEADGATALSHLLRSSRSTRVRVWAERAPFEMKDLLKARGYRWNGGGDGRPKAWWTEVDEGDLAGELRFLEEDVHLRGGGLRRDVLTAHVRHRPG